MAGREKVSEVVSVNDADKHEKERKKNQATPATEMEDDCGLLKEELSKMETELKTLEEGSVAKMFLQLRIDLKKDNLNMYQKMDKKLSQVTSMVEKVSKLQQENTEMANGIQSIVAVQTEEKQRLTKVDEKVEMVSKQLKVLQGFVQKHDQRHNLQRIQGEQTQLRNVKDNLMISGLDEENEESPTTTAEMVTDFFTQTMKITKPIEIQSATWIGKASPRTVLVKLQDSTDKSVIFKNGKELKDVRNSKDGEMYVNSQLPPFLQEKKKWYRYLMKHNASLTGTNKLTMKIQKGELMVNGRPFVAAVRPPSLSKTMYPIDSKHVERMKLQRGQDQTKDNCKFIGFSTDIRNIADVRAAYVKIARLNSSVLHISCGYRLPGMDFPHLRGAVDDGEHGAGKAIYFALEESNIFNRAVFVVRYYGNKHLGPIRFQLIKDAARSAVQRSPYNELTDSYQLNRANKDPEVDSEISFRKGVAVTKSNYVSVTLPRPFSQMKTTNWGSTESLSSSNSFKEPMDPVLGAFGLDRPRANSVDSSTSFNSVNSARQPDTHH